MDRHPRSHIPRWAAIPIDAVARIAVFSRIDELASIGVSCRMVHLQTIHAAAEVLQYGALCTRWE